MCRGNRKEDIFFDDRDRDRDRDTFLCTLGEACEQTGWVVHCYVLMSNHYHLLLETLGMGTRTSVFHAAKRYRNGRSAQIRRIRKALLDLTD